MWNSDVKKMNVLNHTKEGQEKSKKIYRSISERVKSLDDTRGCATCIKDLFLPSVQIQRSRLQEYCERLIFSEPISFGLKAEELLWRKAYYEVISTAKRLKKAEYTIEEKSALTNHINAGIGHYHHYISRLQTEFEINFEEPESTIDFYIIKKAHKTTKSTLQTLEKDLEEWCLASIHRSCIYLGDLCRYKLEIFQNWDPNIAIRYYSQALLLKPEYGMPHNQMGTLATSLNQHLDATYHYIQCLMSKHVFEGTENNLHRLFEKNAQFIESLPVESADGASVDLPTEPVEQVKRFISRFLLLADVWFFNKKVPHIYDLCHQTNLDLQECLSFLRPVSSENGDSQNGDQTDTESESITYATYLTSDMIFKIIVICLQCITKLQASNNSHQLSNVIAFTLAVYSQLVQHITGRIQEAILNFPLQENKKTRKKLKLFARRRKKIVNDDDDSESDIEMESLSGSDEEIDDEELVLESSDDEEEEEIQDDDDADVIIETKDPVKEALAKLKLIEVKDVLDIILEESYFDSVKILSDWLRSDLDVLHSCGKTTRSLFSQLVYLFNLINVDMKKIKHFKCNLNVPLTEDILLKDMEVINGGQQGLEWKVTCRRQDEGLVRICKLIAFGRFLEEHNETGVSYDVKSRSFHVDMRRNSCGDDLTTTTIEDLEAFDENAANTKQTDRDTKRQLMKHMGQLWLAAEVRDLESRVKGKMSLSPYLVVDVEALIKHMDMVKQLVYSRKFLILVPTTVLCALDDLKKQKSEAREVIRWLESQFRQGNRFFRLQRHHERLTLPLIKYPKKKDKEATIHIQIIECCHFLAEQEKRGGSNLVTLLMGGAINSGSGLTSAGGGVAIAAESKEFSYLGLAQSVGVNVELISDFYAKWKKTSKGNKGR